MKLPAYKLRKKMSLIVGQWGTKYWYFFWNIVDSTYFLSLMIFFKLCEKWEFSQNFACVKSYFLQNKIRTFVDNIICIYFLIFPQYLLCIMIAKNIFKNSLISYKPYLLFYMVAYVFSAEKKTAQENFKWAMKRKEDARL